MYKNRSQSSARVGLSPLEIFRPPPPGDAAGGRNAGTISDGYGYGQG